MYNVWLTASTDHLTAKTMISIACHSKYFVLLWNAKTLLNVVWYIILVFHSPLKSGKYFIQRYHDVKEWLTEKVNHTKYTHIRVHSSFLSLDKYLMLVFQLDGCWWKSVIYGEWNPLLPSLQHQFVWNRQKLPIGPVSRQHQLWTRCKFHQWNHCLFT